MRKSLFILGASLILAACSNSSSGLDKTKVKLPRSENSGADTLALGFWLRMSPEEAAEHFAELRKTGEISNDSTYYQIGPYSDLKLKLGYEFFNDKLYSLSLLGFPTKDDADMEAVTAQVLDMVESGYSSYGFERKEEYLSDYKNYVYEAPTSSLSISVMPIYTGIMISYHDLDILDQVYPEAAKREKEKSKKEYRGI